MINEPNGLAPPPSEKKGMGNGASHAGTLFDRSHVKAFLLGAASVPAFAPVGWYPLIWLTLGGLFSLLDVAPQTPRRTRQGALIGGAFGFGLFITGVSWIYVSLNVFGGMPMPLAAFATLLFCLVLAVYPALAGAAFVRFAPNDHWRRALLFAALWTLGEWLRGWLLTGFPWLATGYSQTPPSPLAGFAPLFGVYGLSFLTALCGALLFTSLRIRKALPRRKKSRASQWPAAAPMFAIALFFVGGHLLSSLRWTTPAGDPLSVALLQGNIAQEMKWRAEKFDETLRIYYRLAEDNPAQLTVLPETAIPAFLSQVPAAYVAGLETLAERRQGDLLLGVPVDHARQYFNAAVSIGHSGRQTYAKSHLVPFGEFVPPGFAWFLSLADIPMSDFASGPIDQPPLRLGNQKVAVNICYEDAFGEEIIRALPEATLLVNISNVAWFGDSLAPAQHLQIARLRSLETGRMSLRATNTGMTAIIDADGRVRSVLPPFTRGALRGEVRGYVGSTPFMRWGNWPVILLATLLAFACARRSRAQA